jgi:hypothetical protein
MCYNKTMVPIINYWAVLAATAVSIVLGFLWYGPIFGKKWMALLDLTPEKMASAKAKGMGPTYAIMIVGSLLMSYVLAHALIFGNAYLGTAGVSAGLMVGFWNWLGFVAPVTVGSVLWEGKSWTLWALNAGYYLVALLLMGVVLAVWM